MPKLMILDDDPAFTIAAELLVRAAIPDIQLNIIHSPAEALRAIKDYQPDFLFLDLNMPQLSGWEFLEKIDRNTVGQKIYILSSSVDHNDINRAYTYDMVSDFISKPLTVKKIRQLLN